MAAKIIFLYEFNEEKCPLVEEMELPFYKIIYKVVVINIIVYYDG